MAVILFVVNSSPFFVSHRLPIAQFAKEAGHEIHVAAAYDNRAVSEIEKAGILFHEVEFSRKGINPFFELKTMVSLYYLFRKIKPDLVHLVTIKPYLYGGFAARIAKIPSVVSSVAGLGILFSSNAFKYIILRSILKPFYRIAFGHNNQRVIFQNTADRSALVGKSVVSRDKAVMIRGSGVDLESCPYLVEPVNVPVISFAARLLIDKGVEVFAEASRILKGRNIEARFWLIGEPDPGNANSVTKVKLMQWESEGLVELLGFRQDIPDLFAQSNIVTLPSFYGEGLPKVLVEAAACGRAVITTDHPGCRDAIEPDKTGLLVPIKDPFALADAIAYLIVNSDVRYKMGEAGRALAEKDYAIERIVAMHMNIYQDLIDKAKFN